MSDQAESPATFEPIPEQERFRVIDVLRGFALFGVLAANMRGFGSPAVVYFYSQLMWPGLEDRLAQGFIDLFISGKFITLFSFLFGFGFAAQMTRADSRGARFAPVFLRRLLVLLMIGLAHALLLWWGDILAPYALTGFLLLLFRERSQVTVLVWAIVTMLFPLLLQIVFLGLDRLGIGVGGSPMPSREAIEETVRAYSRGGLAQIMTARIRELAVAYVGLGFYFAPTLGKFLLGLYVWRRGIFQNIPKHLDLWRKVMRFGLPAGLLCNLVSMIVLILWNPDPITPSGPGLVVNLGFTIGMPALSASYASALVLLFQNEGWKKRMEPLAAVGRMALSNYLLQSLTCTTLFYSYGFGLYGKVGPAMGLFPTFLIYLAQISLSAWWLKRFRFGPMEWLWRSLTYAKVQPMRPLGG